MKVVCLGADANTFPAALPDSRHGCQQLSRKGGMVRPVSGWPALVWSGATELLRCPLSDTILVA